MTIKLRDIFISRSNQELYTKKELFALKMSRRFIKEMAISLNLNYLEDCTYEANLCFADHRELQPAYRTVFTKMDIIHYVNHMLCKDYFNMEVDEVTFPNDVTIFWETVKNSSK